MSKPARTTGRTRRPPCEAEPEASLPPAPAVGERVRIPLTQLREFLTIHGLTVVGSYVKPDGTVGVALADAPRPEVTP